MSRTPGSDPRASAPVGSDELAWPEDAVEVGCILDAWGVKGWFKVQAYSSDAQALFSSRRWFLRAPEGNAPAVVKVNKPLPRLLKILSIREHGEGLVANAQDYADRNAAESLRGARIFISRVFMLLGHDTEAAGYKVHLAFQNFRYAARAHFQSKQSAFISIVT